MTGAVATWNELAADCPFYGVAIGGFVFASQRDLMINENM